MLHRIIVALAPVLGGCQGDPQSPQSPSNDPVVAEAAPSGRVGTLAADHPNEPADFTRFAEWAATALFADGGTKFSSGSGILAGQWWRFPGGFSTTADATASTSPANVIAYTWRAGLAPGTSPGTLSWWADANATGYSKIYEAGWIKIPSATFEQHGPSGGLKMFGFWASGQTGASNNNLFGWTTGVGPSPVAAFKFELRQQGFVPRNLVQNVDTQARLTCGSWHRYEILMEVNTVGTANGTFQMWIDGLKTHTYTDVIYRTSRYPAKFFARKWDATWGGAGGGNKTRTDQLWIDHLYMSGVR